MKTIFFKLLIIILFFSSVISHAAEIYIDCSKMKPFPELFTASIWLDGNQLVKNLTDFYMLKKFLKENNPAVIQWSLPIWLLPQSKSFNDFKTRFKKYIQEKPVQFLIKTEKREGFWLIVGFQESMPTWLSSRPNWNQPALEGSESWTTIQMLSPPRDYNLWAALVEYVLKSLKDLGVKRLGFFVGHEPNWLWLGNEESFFKLYAYAARAAKKVDKNIKVGGIGPWCIHAPKEKYDSKVVAYSKFAREILRREDPGPYNEPMLKNFIKYVSKNNVPLDFINWHAFYIYPPQFIKIAKDIRNWIREAGLDEKYIELYPADWTYWSMPSMKYPADILDTNEMAAYIPTALYYMHKAGINWHGHDFNIRDWGYEKKVILNRKSTFIGDWPIFTRDGVIKPSYNAFKMISMLTGGDKEKTLILATNTSDPQITAIATLNLEKKQVAVLLTNFCPSGKMKYLGLLNLIKSDKHYPQVAKEVEVIKSKLKGKRITKKSIILLWNKLIKNTKNAEKKQVFLYFKDLIQTYLNKRKLSQKVNIFFKNFPFFYKAVMTTYTIDQNQANACYLNKSTEHQQTETICGVGGIIDKEIRHGKQTIRAMIEQYLKSLGYTKEEMKNIFKQGLIKVKDILSKEKVDQIRQMYWKYLDAINNKQGVSLESTKQVKTVNITDRDFSLEIEMPPNSLKLIIFTE